MAAEVAVRSSLVVGESARPAIDGELEASCADAVDVVSRLPVRHAPSSGEVARRSISEVNVLKPNSLRFRNAW
jgi:hypothetical protein